MTTKQIFDYDRAFGFTVAGIDEAGRGPLAGPVVSACCSIDYYIEGINDSKKVSEKKREQLYELIIEKASAYGISIIGPEEIDRINILEATKKGMTEAAFKMNLTPALYLIDAVKGLKLNAETKPIIKGDANSYSIAAASILAKVTRDRIMREYDKIYPEYGFEKHKGYGTKFHIDALKTYGPSPIHRKTFIKNFVQL